MSSTHPLDHPWSLDGRGRTRATDRDGHVRDLLEQVLLTSPGERVMRPELGSGLLAMTFEPGGPEVAAAAELLLRGSLERELATVLALEQLSVEAVDAALVVTVAYTVRRSGAHAVATVHVPVGGAR